MWPYVGENHIPPSQDTGLDRSWCADIPYIYGFAFGVSYYVDLDTNMTIQYPPIIPSYVAPTNVYATARSIGLILKSISITT